MKRPAGSPPGFLFYLIPLTVIALVAGAWLALSRHEPEEPASSDLTELWNLSLPDIQGQQHALSQWRGQVVVVNFWASWCAPCREEMPDFVALRTQFQPKGVEFIGIAIDNPASITQFLRQLPVNYPILIGEGVAHGLARQLGNPSRALPYTIVIDRDGKIVLKHLGRLPRAALESTLRQLAP